MKKIVVAILIITTFQCKVLANILPEFAPITLGVTLATTNSSGTTFGVSTTQKDSSVVEVTAVTKKQIIVDFDKRMNANINLEQVNKIKPGEFYQVIIQNIDLATYIINISSVDTVLSVKQKTPTFGDVKASTSNGISEKITVSQRETLPNDIYYSLPLQFTKEQTFLSISITPRKKEDAGPENKNQSYSTRLTFPFSKKGYNVTGISYYVSGLYDETFSIQKPTDTTSIYKSEPTSSREVGISVMYKAGGKIIKDWFGAHASIGVGASIANNVRPRILLGGGLSFGTKHMISVDFGGIAGMVDRLTSAVVVGKEYSVKQVPSPITKQVLETSCFFSVGYLFRF